MTDPRTSIENHLTAIPEDEAIAPDDRDLLCRFSERLDLLSNEYGDYRHLKLLGHCRRMAAGCEGDVLGPALHDREAAERAVAWINDTYDNEETNRDYRTALRMFGKRVTDDDEIPDSLAWIPTGTSKTYDPSPDPRDMLEWADHIVPMAEAANNPRDAALITLGFDAGLRGFELFDLTVGDVADHEYGAQVTAEGKTGRRKVVLVPSVEYVNRWLEYHPDAATAAPLWCELEDGQTRISRQRFYQIFNRLSELADINRPVTPTNLRKSSAAYLARHNVNQVHIEDHHGWVRGSRVASRYIATFGTDTDREIAKAHGVDVSDDEPEAITPIPCPRCGQDTPRGRDFCLHCQQALVPGAVELVEELADLLDDQAIAADDLEERRSLIQARRSVENNPGMLDSDHVHEVLNSLSD